MMLLTCLVGIAFSAVFNRLIPGRPNMRRDSTPPPDAPKGSWWCCKPEDFSAVCQAQQQRMSGIKTIEYGHSPNLQLARDSRTIPSSYAEGELTDDAV